MTSDWSPEFALAINLSVTGDWWCSWNDPGQWCNHARLPCWQKDLGSSIYSNINMQQYEKVLMFLCQAKLPNADPLVIWWMWYKVCFWYKINIFLGSGGGRAWSIIVECLNKSFRGIGNRVIPCDYSKWVVLTSKTVGCCPFQWLGTHSLIQRSKHWLWRTNAPARLCIKSGVLLLVDMRRNALMPFWYIS